MWVEVTRVWQSGFSKSFRFQHKFWHNESSALCTTSTIRTAMSVKSLSTCSIPWLSLSVDSSSEPSSKTESSPPFILNALLFLPHKHSSYHDMKDRVLSKDPQDPQMGVDLCTSPSSPPQKPQNPSMAIRQCTLDAKQHMFGRYRPYRKWANPPLELHFATRVMGCSSYTEMALEDVDEISALRV